MKNLIYISTILLSTINPIFSQNYFGGNSDGFSTSTYNDATNIFAGGNSDGFSTSTYNDATNIFAGGNSDGFSTSAYNDATNIFAGGNSDGFSTSAYYDTINIFAGGESDGFSMSNYDADALTYVPDNFFEQALIDLGYDVGPLDDYVPTANISNITFLFINSEQIFDLTGIEDFTALEYLDCSNNFLTSLDLSGNTALIELNCERNALISIDVTQCLALDRLSVWRNQLTTINTSQNINLTRLICFNNNINALDLTQNTVLENLFCDENQLNTLDVTQNTALTSLTCEDNQLNTLDVTQNILLEDLRFRNNLLTTIDLSYNTLLNRLSGTNNQLVSLDLVQNVNLLKVFCGDNQLISLNVKNGNNLNIITFDALNNPNLTCIEVDNAAYSTANWTDIDATASFSENCGFCTDTTTYTSSGWNPAAPTENSSVIIAFNYNSAVVGASIDACEITINAGVTLTIGAGDYLNVNGNILVDGILDVEHEGSIVQISNDATVTNNGSIQVEKTMNSFNDPTDFAILGSPMTAETRDGVYAINNLTMNHLTSNFVPNPDVALADPLAENFADDNGDNWQFYTSSEAIISGVGYLVGGVTGGGIFTNTYTQGTLNNGIINYNTFYNGTQNASPNMLSNPYASAIDAAALITNNAVIDEVYFWEHLTPPTNTYPGYRSDNWDMGDISMYNLSGGIAAANGGSVPSQFIPSGQGFGIKANAGGVVEFNNSLRVTGFNTGYRNALIERLHLSVKNEIYDLKSSTLIAFTAEATDGIDPKYDAKRLAIPLSIYSVVEEEELSIQGRSEFNEEQIIDIGFRAQVEESQEYSISLNSVEGESISLATVYLIDNFLQIITNLNETDYNFSSGDGNYKERFKIVFRNQVLGIDDFTNNTINIYPNPTKGVVTIVSPNAEILSLTLFDLQGRKVANTKAVLAYQATFNLASFNNAVYFLEVKTQNGAVIKRIVKY